MKKFNYQSDYKKFKNGDKVKITFKDDKETVTKNVRIISINSKKISFEDKEDVYECTPSEIINIKKRIFKKVLLIFVACTIFLYLCLVGIRILKYEEYRKSCGKDESFFIADYVPTLHWEYSIFRGCYMVDDEPKPCYLPNGDPCVLG